MTELSRFLQTLYRDADPDEHWTFGHMGEGQRMRHTPVPVSNLDAAQKLVEGLTVQGQHVWLCSATGGPKVKDAVRQYIVSLDVDLAGPGHQSKNNPTDTSCVDEALLRLGLPRPTILLRTGGGYLYIWRLQDPQQPDGRYAKALQAAVRREIAPFNLDPTADVTRLIRVPEGINFKAAYGPTFPTVEIDEENPTHEVAAEDLLALMPAPPASRRHRTAKLAGDRVTAIDGKNDFDVVISGCQAMSHLATHPVEQTEPLWLAAASLAAVCQDGEAAFQAFSAGYPGYEPQEAAAKYDHARRFIEDGGGPATCAHITEIGGRCEGCPFAGRITSPVALAKSAPAIVDVSREYVHTTAGDFLKLEEIELRGAKAARLGQKTFDFGVAPRLGQRSTSALLTTDLFRRMQTTVYRPGHSRFIDPDTTNLWSPSPLDPRPGDWSRVGAVLANVFQGDVYHNYALKLLARHLRDPGLQTSVIMVLMQTQGSGKGSLGEILKHCLGAPNYRVLSADAMDGKWSSEFVDCQLLHIDELQGVRDPKAVAGRLKMLSGANGPIEVEAKGLSLRPGLPARLHLLTTNDRMPLPLDEEGDRRMFVPPYVRDKLDRTVGAFINVGPQEARMAEFAAFLHHLLHEVDLTGFDHRDIPDSPDRRMLLTAGMLPLRRVLFDAIEEQAGPFTRDVVTSEACRAYASLLLDRRVSLNEAAETLKSLGHQKRKIDRGTAGKSTYWIVRNVEFWQAAPGKDLTAHADAAGSPPPPQGHPPQVAAE